MKTGRKESREFVEERETGRETERKRRRSAGREEGSVSYIRVIGRRESAVKTQRKERKEVRG